MKYSAELIKRIMQREILYRKNPEIIVRDLLDSVFRDQTEEGAVYNWDHWLKRTPPWEAYFGLRSIAWLLSNPLPDLDKFIKRYAWIMILVNEDTSEERPGEVKEYTEWLQNQYKWMSEKYREKCPQTWTQFVQEKFPDV